MWKEVEAGDLGRASLGGHPRELFMLALIFSLFLSRFIKLTHVCTISKYQLKKI